MKNSEESEADSETDCKIKPALESGKLDNEVEKSQKGSLEAIAKSILEDEKIRTGISTGELKGDNRRLETGMETVQEDDTDEMNLVIDISEDEDATSMKYSDVDIFKETETNHHPVKQCQTVDFTTERFDQDDINNNKGKQKGSNILAMPETSAASGSNDTPSLHSMLIRQELMKILPDILKEFTSNMHKSGSNLNEVSQQSCSEGSSKVEDQKERDNLLQNPSPETIIQRDFVHSVLDANQLTPCHGKTGLKSIDINQSKNSVTIKDSNEKDLLSNERAHHEGITIPSVRPIVQNADDEKQRVPSVRPIVQNADDEKQRVPSVRPIVQNADDEKQRVPSVRPIVQNADDEKQRVFLGVCQPVEYPTTQITKNRYIDPVYYPLITKFTPVKKKKEKAILVPMTDNANKKREKNIQKESRIEPEHQVASMMNMTTYSKDQLESKRPIPANSVPKERKLMVKEQFTLPNALERSPYLWSYWNRVSQQEFPIPRNEPTRKSVPQSKNINNQMENQDKTNILAAKCSVKSNISPSNISSTSNMTQNIMFPTVNKHLNKQSKEKVCEEENRSIDGCSVRKQVELNNGMIQQPDIRVSVLNGKKVFTQTDTMTPANATFTNLEFLQHRKSNENLEEEAVKLKAHFNIDNEELIFWKRPLEEQMISPITRLKVEDITDCKVMDGRWYYRLKWCKYTWERSDSLQKNGALKNRLQEFHKNSQRFQNLKLATEKSYLDEDATPSRNRPSDKANSYKLTTSTSTETLSTTEPGEITPPVFVVEQVESISCDSKIDVNDAPRIISRRPEDDQNTAVSSLLALSKSQEDHHDVMFEIEQNDSYAQKETKASKRCFEKPWIKEANEKVASLPSDYDLHPDPYLKLVELDPNLKVNPILLSIEKEPHTTTVKEFDFVGILRKAKVQRSHVQQRQAKRYSCQHCKRNFFGKKKLHSHTMGPSKSVCPLCGIAISCKVKMIKHIESHAVSAHRCFVCFKMFSTEAECTKHKDEAHSMVKTSFSVKKHLRTCTNCRKGFKTHLEYLKHRKLYCVSSLKKTNKPFKCGFCNKSFKRQSSLDVHEYCHQHLINIIVNKQSPLKLINRRDIIMKNAAKLRRKTSYTRGHTKRKKNYCMKCTQGFKNRDEFYQHINTKTCPYLEDKGECMLCKATFHSLEKLKMHVTNCFKESFASLLKPQSRSSGNDVSMNKTRAVYHCIHCNRMFPSFFTFNKHKVLFHPKKSASFKCHTCSFQCQSRNWFSAHIKKKLCPKVEVFRCFYCDYQRKPYSLFESLSELVSHFAAIHKPTKKKSLITVKPAEIILRRGGKVWKKRRLYFPQEDLDVLKGKSAICSLKDFGEYQVTCKPVDGNYQLIASKLVTPISPVDNFGVADASIECSNPSLDISTNREEMTTLSPRPIKALGNDQVVDLHQDKDNHPTIDQDKDTPVKCFACSEQFADIWCTLQHFRKHHKYRCVQLFNCDDCHIVFKDSEMYNLHMKFFHTSLSKTKAITKDEFKSKGWNFIYLCPLCDLPFLRWGDLHEHCLDSHNLSNIPNKPLIINWPCCYCHKKITSIYHHALEHCSTMLECFHCNVKVSNESSLKRHMEQSHGKTWDAIDEQWIKQAMFSDAQTTMREMYQQRKRDVNQQPLTKEQRKFQCDNRNCRLVFFHESTLQRHHSICKSLQSNVTRNSMQGLSKSGPLPVRTTNQTLPLSPIMDFISCPVCSLLFTCDKQLQIHLNAYHEMLPVCKKMSEIMSRKEKISREAISTVQCDICDGQFVDECAMWQDKMAHVGIELEACQVCHDIFRNEMALLVHCYCHHRIFLCLLCRKGLHSLDMLVEHCQLHVYEANIPRDEKGKMIIEIDGNISTRVKTKLFPLSPTKSKTNNADAEDINGATSFFVCSKVPSHILTDERLFFCHICYKNIEGQLTFIVHMKTHTSNRHMLCFLCKKKFAEIYQLEQHLAQHRKSVGFKLNAKHHDTSIDSPEEHMINVCTTCSEVFENPSELQCHLRRFSSQPNDKDLLKGNTMVHSVRLYVKEYLSGVLLNQKGSSTSTECRSTSAEWNVMEALKLPTIFELPMIFELLQKKFNSMTHVKGPTPNVNSSVLNSEICRYCFVHVDAGKPYRNHNFMHKTKGVDIKCVYCSEIFSNRLQLSSHVCSSHAGDSDVKRTYDLDAQMFCKYCNLDTNLDHIKLHYKDISWSSKNIRCPFCSYIFPANTFQNHLTKAVISESGDGPESVRKIENIVEDNPLSKSRNLNYDSQGKTPQSKRKCGLHSVTDVTSEGSEKPDSLGDSQSNVKEDTILKNSKSKGKRKRNIPKRRSDSSTDVFIENTNVEHIICDEMNTQAAISIHQPASMAIITDVQDYDRDSGRHNGFRKSADSSEKDQKAIKKEVSDLQSLEEDAFASKDVMCRFCGWDFSSTHKLKSHTKKHARLKSEKHSTNRHISCHLCPTILRQADLKTHLRVKHYKKLMAHKRGRKRTKLLQKKKKSKESDDDDTGSIEEWEIMEPTTISEDIPKQQTIEQVKKANEILAEQLPRQAKKSNMKKKHIKMIEKKHPAIDGNKQTGDEQHLQLVKKSNISKKQAIKFQKEHPRRVEKEQTEGEQEEHPTLSEKDQTEDEQHLQLVKKSNIPKKQALKFQKEHPRIVEKEQTEGEQEEHPTLSEKDQTEDKQHPQPTKKSKRFKKRVKRLDEDYPAIREKDQRNFQEDSKLTQTFDKSKGKSKICQKKRLKYFYAEPAEPVYPYPFTCTVCLKGFFTRFHYLAHFKSVHPWLYDAEKEKTPKKSNLSSMSGGMIPENKKTPNKGNPSRTPSATIPESEKTPKKSSPSSPLCATIPQSEKAPEKRNSPSTFCGTTPENGKTPKNSNPSSTPCATIPENEKAPEKSNSSSTFCETIPENGKTPKKCNPSSTPGATIPDIEKTPEKSNSSSAFCETIPENGKTPKKSNPSSTPGATIPEIEKTPKKSNSSSTPGGTIPQNEKDSIVVVNSLNTTQVKETTTTPVDSKYYGNNHVPEQTQDIEAKVENLLAKKKCSKAKLYPPGRPRTSNLSCHPRKVVRPGRPPSAFKLKPAETTITDTLDERKLIDEDVSLDESSNIDSFEESNIELKIVEFQPNDEDIQVEVIDGVVSRTNTTKEIKQPIDSETLTNQPDGKPSVIEEGEKESCEAILEANVEKSTVKNMAEESSEDESSKNEIEEETKEEVIESSCDETKLTTRAKNTNVKIGGKALNCEKCKVNFFSQDQFNTHLKFHESTHSVSTYPCSQCSALFYTEIDLVEHSKVHKSECEEMATVKVPEANRKVGHYNISYPFVCVFCGLGFYKRSPLRIHLLNKHKDSYHRDYEKSAVFVNLNYEGDVKKTVSERQLPKRKHSRFEEVMKSLKSRKQSPAKVKTVLSTSGCKRPANDNISKVLNSKKKKKTDSLSKESSALTLKIRSEINLNKEDGENRRLTEEQLSENSDSDAEDTEEFRHTCKYCDQLFSTKDNMIKHRTHHFKGAKLNELTCVACFCLVSRHELKWHMHINHDDLKLSEKKKYCSHCNFASKKGLEKHIIDVHPSLLKIECRICDARFSTTSSYNKHYQMTHGKSIDEEALLCLFCNKKFQSLTKLYGHFSIIHMKKNRNLYCTLCSKYFYGRADLESHQEEFHQKDKYQCGLCFVDFESVTSCEKHVLVHKESSDYQCKLCKFYFNTNETLNKHFESHSEILKCLVCDQCFKNVSDYQAHKEINNCNHSTAKILCMMCDHLFESEDSLVEHMETHAMRKNFECASCEMSFKTLTDIQNHMEQVHQGGSAHSELDASNKEADTIVYETDVECDERFLAYASNNQCEKCGETFIRHEIFLEHMKKHEMSEKSN